MLKLFDQLSNSGAAKGEALTAGGDGDGNFVRFGGTEDKDDVSWWFFKGFEEGVKGAGGEHMDFV